MNNTPGHRQLLCRDLHRRGEALSPSNSTHKNNEQTSNQKIMSPTTSTITSNLIHPSEVAALVPSSADLPDLQKLCYCPKTCHFPGPNGPLLQMMCHYWGTVFSHVHSTHAQTCFKTMDKFRYVKLTFLPNTRSCTFSKKDGWQQKACSSG